jgi:hypothetical protein
VRANNHGRYVVIDGTLRYLRPVLKEDRPTPASDQEKRVSEKLITLAEHDDTEEPGESWTTS